MAVVLLGAAACTVSHPAPVASVPSVAPVATIINGACSTGFNGEPEFKTDGLVTVDAHPAGLVAVWIPGFNDRPCRSALTRATSSQAARIAADIRSSPAATGGKRLCPNDDNSAIRLYFEYVQPSRIERVDVHLRGCAYVAAPGRSARNLSVALTLDLLPIAPEPWHSRMRAFSAP